jgi:hypothetical protein
MGTAISAIISCHQEDTRSMALRSARDKRYILHVIANWVVKLLSMSF